jgi:hypothetical protein
MKSIKRIQNFSAGALSGWQGETHLRVTAWPDLRFEKQSTEGWVELSGNEELSACQALNFTRGAWERYLQSVPFDVRGYLERFSSGRLTALLVLVRCPSLHSTLMDCPALAIFLAQHPRLCGTHEPRWSQIETIHEREGVFGLFAWLGLPASRQTLAVLAHLPCSALVFGLLEALRTRLWEPAVICAFSREELISERHITQLCQPCAA